ncbi:ABC transporter ATP-binding protein [Pseudanabaena sp. FACHB-2040]|uniref:ABC transporter ATP-binding protein n=1 Tax=Pseudanabaena sp. FACHB-2040 TaxID=2692859 RepID=UPI0016836CC4|nr:ABC transporter ATP-binding protein [Pseudanabaena sp. FACHB-2040]MBD2260598.1 ABC transporter ATP-binding protein [Pseudanabaena sp. FACHB-2040]
MLQYFKKIWFILGDSGRKLPSLFLFFIFSSVLETFGIGMLGPFFAVVSDPALIQRVPILQQVYNVLNVSSNETFIIFLCILIAVVFVIKSIAYLLSKFYILKFSHSHRAKIVQKLNRAYLNSDYNYFISKNSSGLTKNIISETQAFCSSVLLSLLYGISNCITLALLCWLMYTANSLLLTAILASLLPVILLIYGLKNKLKVWGQTLSEATQKVIQTLNQGLGGFKETRVIGAAPYFETQMTGYAQQYARTASLVGSFEMMPRVLIEASLVIFIVSFVAISQIVLSNSTEQLISSLSVFAVASIRLLPAASQIISAVGNLQSTRHVVDILYADLKESEKQLSLHSSSIAERASKEAGSVASKISFNNKIQLSKVFYQYSQELNPAINGISLEINKGESVAFIGKSGAGKTTLVDVILGLLVPQKGGITVDGESIYNDLRAWQNLIGYIPQSIFLLDDTVERNIAFGVPDHLIDYQKLEAAVAAAQLEEVVTQLPNGIHTRVGERGVMLSGGQRQRIGIARALYHEREILVLDEATSALDNETEKQITAAIQNLSGKKSVIMIAHRLSTVEHCNRVYLLEKGMVVKSGSFIDVMAS